MKKLVIISYFYPPANFVGGDRTASWAKYLHESGYYPIVITRHWNKGQIDLVDKLNHNELEVERNGTHEVHRLPYKRSLRDRCSEYRWLKPIQKALTLFELIASNFFISALPYANFYTYSKQLIKNDPSLSIVLASGRPFQSFAIGHQLKKDFPHIHWIPDYRDEWTTRSTTQSRTLFRRLLFFLEQRSERKWVSSSSCFITTSNQISTSIQNQLLILGHTVLNGFDEQPSQLPPEFPSKTFNIVYSGTLYAYQNITLLINSVRQICSEHGYDINVHYLGVNMNPDQMKRLKNEINTASDIFYIHPRMSQEKLMDFYSTADILYLTSYEENKGWLPVKLFEYFNLEKPILLCPSDKDVMEKFILETGSGFVANSTEECITILQHLMNVKQGVESLTLRRNEMAGEKYSRRHQAKVLASVLDKVGKEKP